MNLNLTPRATPKHWSSDYIGKPWELGAEGPNAFDCWGLARWVQERVYGRELPQLRIAQTDKTRLRVLLDLMRNTGWVNLPDWQEMQDGDLLRMEGPAGAHIGVVVRLSPSRPVEVLHVVGGKDYEGKSHGAAERAAPHQLISEGYGKFEAWRWC